MPNADEPIPYALTPAREAATGLTGESDAPKVRALTPLAEASLDDTYTVASLQAALPWGAHGYNRAFQARTDPQRDAGHALLHIAKATGKLADLLDAWDHDPAQPPPDKYLADLIICTLRLANTWPGGRVAMERALANRLAEKFPAKDGAA